MGDEPAKLRDARETARQAAHAWLHLAGYGFWCSGPAAARGWDDDDCHDADCNTLTEAFQARDASHTRELDVCRWVVAGLHDQLNDAASDLERAVGLLRIQHNGEIETCNACEFVRDYDRTHQGGGK